MMCHIKRLALGGAIVGGFALFVSLTIYYELIDYILGVVLITFGLILAYALGSIFVEDPKNKEDTSRIDWGERGSR